VFLHLRPRVKADDQEADPAQPSRQGFAYSAVPVLWCSEFRNILAGLIRIGKLLPHDAEGVLRRAASSLTGGERVVSDHAVLTLVAASRCTAYDCEFVALAEALGTVLITEDQAVLAAFPKLCLSLEQIIKRPA
jgi:predicted nucleic acid-binding protein